MKLEIVRCDIQHRGRGLLRLFGDEIRCAVDGIARGHGLPAGKGAEPERRRRGVAGNDENLRRLDAERSRYDLSEHGLDALPLRGRARGDGDASGGKHANGRALEGTAPGALDVIAQPDADEAARFARAVLARGGIVPTRGIERAVLTFGIIAAVV